MIKAILNCHTLIIIKIFNGHQSYIRPLLSINSFCSTKMIFKLIVQKSEDFSNVTLYIIELWATPTKVPISLEWRASKMSKIVR